MPIDPYSQLAFVEILNILLTAGHIVDVNRFLISYVLTTGYSICLSVSWQQKTAGKTRKRQTENETIWKLR